jgi:hypothetical protein
MPLVGLWSMPGAMPGRLLWLLQLIDGLRRHGHLATCIAASAEWGLVTRIHTQSQCGKEYAIVRLGVRAKAPVTVTA